MGTNKRYNTELAKELKDLNKNSSLKHFQIAEKYELSINELRYLLYRYKEPEEVDLILLLLEHLKKLLKHLKKFFRQ